MEKSTIRVALADKLDVADLKYDISRMTAEMRYHKSKTDIFVQTIKAQQVELDNILGTKQDPTPKAGVYQ